MDLGWAFGKGGLEDLAPRNLLKTSVNYQVRMSRKHLDVCICGSEERSKVEICMWVTYTRMYLKPLELK